MTKAISTKMFKPIRKIFSLNGLITLELISSRKYIEYFENEYFKINHRTDKNSGPKVTLKIVDRLNRSDSRSIVYKNLFHFHFCIDRLDALHTVIEFERHWLDRIYVVAVGSFIQGQILEPVIYYKLLQNNVLFMHAAAVCKDGASFVFPAHGGTGKTTLSLGMMRLGYQLMGDDLIMVEAKTGKVHPYARPLHLFEYNLKSLNVPSKVKLAIYTKSFIRKLFAIFTGEKFLISTRVHAGDIMDVATGEISDLKRIIFLKKDGAPSRYDLSLADQKKAAVAMVSESADLNDSLVQNIGVTDDFFRLEDSVISQVLSHVSEMRAVNARSIKSKDDRTRFASQYLS